MVVIRGSKLLCGERQCGCFDVRAVAWLVECPTQQEVPHDELQHMHGCRVLAERACRMHVPVVLTRGIARARQ